jgi:hypothetical protein
MAKLFLERKDLMNIRDGFARQAARFNKGDKKCQNLKRI